jgi:type III pantothenate kinase
MPRLAIDVGNSRIKWGLHDGSHWTRVEAVAHARIDDLESAWFHLPVACKAIGSNVSEPGIARRIDAMLAAKRIPMRWIESRPVQCGVRNLYVDAAQLGSDRWATLIGARAIHPGACLVVNAGTAVTIDALTAEGDFPGGLIIPGLQLMLEALVRDTARLGREPGSFRDFPQTTADAIASGAIHAIAGAVERFRCRLNDRVKGSVGLVATGGAISTLQPHLAPDTRVVDNLVLEGLLIIAAEP